MVTATIATPHTPAAVLAVGRGVVTVTRFLGHFLLALLGVTFLGTSHDH